jgi:hypothetical protein
MHRRRAAAADGSGAKLRTLAGKFWFIALSPLSRSALPRAANTESYCSATRPPLGDASGSAAKFKRTPVPLGVIKAPTATAPSNAPAEASASVLLTVR